MDAKLDIDRSWWHLIAERAATTPDRIFLDDGGGDTLTFGQFARAAEGTAAGFLDLGIEPGHVVSWQLPTSIDAVVTMAALSRLGVRQNPIIPILRHAEVGLITGQLGSEWLITPGTHRGFDFAAMAAESVDLERCTVVDLQRRSTSGGSGLPSGDPSSLPPAPRTGHDVRWYYFSSGTTATPKGVKHSDFSAMSSSAAQVEYLDLGPDDVYPMAFPVTHIGGIMLLTAYLRTGARIIVLDEFDPATTPGLMGQLGATVVGSATPFFLAYLAAQAQQGTKPLFPRLRQIQAGGAPITADLNDRCREAFGVPILNQWGLTEFPAASSQSLGDPEQLFGVGVGRLAPGVEAKTLDSAGGETDVGDEGELWLRGPQCCLGYVDPTLDGDAFDDEGFFRTGDLGTLDEQGFLRITGRLKDVIIRNAENLSAPEIEQALITHPAIEDVAVIGLPDERTGERACALVVVSPGRTEPSLADLADHCAALGLARQKVPEELHVVAGLPRNPMGKVLKHQLRAQLMDD